MAAVYSQVGSFIPNRRDIAVYVCPELKQKIKMRIASFGVKVIKADKLLKSGGKIFACGTCIKSRNQEGAEMCPINTMKDMYDIIKESDKIVTF